MSKIGQDRVHICLEAGATHTGYQSARELVRLVAARMVDRITWSGLRNC